MARPVVALLTDFGLRDHYVGTMKGVVLSVCPDATLVDITPRHSAAGRHGGRAGTRGGYPVLSAGHGLSGRRRSWRRVRAPGASPPRPVATTSSRRTTACCPRSSATAPPTLVVELARGEVRASRRSAERSRDAIALRRPRAGLHGPPLRAVRARRRPTTSPCAFLQPEVTRRRSARGEVVRVDRFGNLISNIRTDDGRPACRSRSPCRAGRHASHRRRADLRRRVAGRGLRARGQFRPSRDRGQRRRARSRSLGRRCRGSPSRSCSGRCSTISGCHDEFRIDRGTAPPRAEHPRVGRTRSRARAFAISIVNTASTSR